LFLVDFRLLELKSNRIVRMASAPPRSVAEATAARDRLMNTLEAQDGTLGGLQADFQKIAEIKRINDAIAKYEKELAAKRIDAAQIQRSKISINFAAGLRLPAFKVTVRSPSGTTVDLKTLKDANDELMKLLKGTGININKSKGIQKTSQELANEIDPQFATADQGLKEAQARRNDILQQIGGINNEILGIKTAPANNGKYRGRSIEDLNREIDKHLQIAETLVETYGTNISIENQRKINTHLSEARNLLAAVAVALTKAEAEAEAKEAKEAKEARASTPAAPAPAPAPAAAAAATQAGRNAAVSATESTQSARVAGERARRVEANLQRETSKAAALNERIADLRGKLEARQKEAQVQAQAMAALPVINIGSSNTITPRTGRAAISSSTGQPKINKINNATLAALTAEHRKGRQAAQGSTFSIENVNNPSTGLRLGPPPPIGATGTGNVKNTPVYKTGNPEVRAQLNAIAAAAADLPPPPQSGVSESKGDEDEDENRAPTPEHVAALEAQRAANAASERAASARAALTTLKANPINTSALTDLTAVQKTLEEENAGLRDLQASLLPVERNINEINTTLEALEGVLRKGAAAIDVAEAEYKKAIEINTRHAKQQIQDALIKKQDENTRQKSALLRQKAALESTIASINRSIAEQTEQIQQLEGKQGKLTGKAANAARKKAESNARIRAAADAAAAAETEAAQAAAAEAEVAAATRELQLGSNNNNNNNNNSRPPGVPSRKQIRANIRAQSGELPYIKPLTSEEQKKANKRQRRQTRNLRAELLKRQQALGLGSNNRPPDPYNVTGNTQLEKNSEAVLAKLNNPLRRNKGIAKGIANSTTKTTTTSTSKMTKRWRCTKPGTDVPCRTTGGRHRHRSTQKQKHKYNRKLNARTKRLKRQRR